MNDLLYDDVKEYLLHGIIPQNIPSSKSNFIATARKYQIDPKGHLTRQNKYVVRISEQEKLYQVFHAGHSGRTACWEKIRDR